MICRLVMLTVVLAWTACLPGSGLAQTYPLTTGEALNGEPIHADPNGVVFKKPDGSFTPRIAFTNFTQTGLKQLAKDPKVKPLIEPLLDLDDEEPAAVKKPKPAIKVKVPPRLDRPDPKASWGALFASPLTASLLFLLYLVNLYAGYEISIFRQYHPALVVGVAAVAPVIGPLLFLCLPAHLIMGEIPAEEEAGAEAAAPAEGGPVETAPEPAASAPAPARGAAKLPPPTIFRRGETMFNRRFFETKLAGFLRLVPSEAEKDMIVYIKSARGEHVGPRITRIMPNELMLHVVKGNASNDVIIPFGDIQEVQIRHKDA